LGITPEELAAIGEDSIREQAEWLAKDEVEWREQEEMRWRGEVREVREDRERGERENQEGAEEAERQEQNERTQEGTTTAHTPRISNRPAWADPGGGPGRPQRVHMCSGGDPEGD
jgi:hypothetical protein